MPQVIKIPTSKIKSNETDTITVSIDPIVIEINLIVKTSEKDTIINNKEIDTIINIKEKETETNWEIPNFNVKKIKFGKE
jgi:hypothetical protein